MNLMSGLSRTRLDVLLPAGIQVVLFFVSITATTPTNPNIGAHIAIKCEGRIDMHVAHLGIATRELGDLVTLFEGLLNAPLVHEETFDGLRVGFLAFDDGSHFELLEPVEDGPIASYLDEHGPGIHHVALGTDDLPAALERARELGVDLVDETPRPGAWGHDVAFCHPRSTGGVLVEFVEE